jgi:hypothetical protein
MIKTQLDLKVTSIKEEQANLKKLEGSKKEVILDCYFNNRKRNKCNHTIIHRLADKLPRAKKSMKNV